MVRCGRAQNSLGFPRSSSGASTAAATARGEGAAPLRLDAQRVKEVGRHELRRDALRRIDARQTRGTGLMQREGLEQGTHLAKVRRERT